MQRARKVRAGRLVLSDATLRGTPFPDRLPGELTGSGWGSCPTARNDRGRIRTDSPQGKWFPGSGATACDGFAELGGGAYRPPGWRTVGAGTWTGTLLKNQGHGNANRG